MQNDLIKTFCEIDLAGGEVSCRFKADRRETEGSYLRLNRLWHHSTLGSRVIKKKKSHTSCSGTTLFWFRVEPPWHKSDSQPDAGLGFQVKVIKTIEGDPSSLGSGPTRWNYLAGCEVSFGVKADRRDMRHVVVPPCFAFESSAFSE